MEDLEGNEGIILWGVLKSDYYKYIVENFDIWICFQIYDGLSSSFLVI